MTADLSCGSAEACMAAASLSAKQACIQHIHRLACTWHPAVDRCCSWAISSAVPALIGSSRTMHEQLQAEATLPITRSALIIT